MVGSQTKKLVVIGAGIVGVSTAIWLQRDGHDVMLVDAKAPGEGTSYGNAGILASIAIVPVTAPGLLGKVPGMLLDKASPLFVRWSYIPRMIPFLLRYLSHTNKKDVEWISAGLNELLHDSPDQHLALAKGTGAEEFIETGDYVFVYDSKADFDADAYTWSVRKARGFAFEELDRDALGDFDPALKGRFDYGVKCPHHGLITDPGAYVKALAAHFADKGGRIVEAEVTGIDQKNGEARAVQTSNGDIDCDGAIITAGAWSGKLMEMVGARVPLESERGYHLEFVNPSIKLRAPTMVASGKFGMSSMRGRLRCAGVIEFGGLEAGPSKGPLELLKQHTLRVFPELEYERTEEWLGHRPATPDSLPLIGEVEGVKNVWAGFGHQHVGLTGGPKTGRWLAQQISGQTPNVDLACYAPSRFN